MFKVEKIIVAVCDLQNIWLLILFNWALGLIERSKSVKGPVQLTPLLVKVGVTLMVAVMGEDPELFAVNIKSPLP